MRTDIREGAIFPDYELVDKRAKNGRCRNFRGAM